jgi:bleomycin hydrolase
VKLPWNDYLLVTSFTYAPFKTFVRLNVPDNWSKDSTYFNVPLDLFYSALKQAVTGGYSAAIDADITEPSYELTKQYAFIPDVDTPAELISQGSREFRFSTGATTDDHLLHVIGFKSFGNEDWFLVKDSWRTAFQGNLSGYFFFHESYVKLKVLAYLVHRDGVPSIKATLPRP